MFPPFFGLSPFHDDLVTRKLILRFELPPSKLESKRSLEGATRASPRDGRCGDAESHRLDAMRPPPDDLPPPLLMSMLYCWPCCSWNNHGRSCERLSRCAPLHIYIKDKLKMGIHGAFSFFKSTFRDCIHSKRCRFGTPIPSQQLPEGQPDPNVIFDNL
jgi:hypothetical protein